jgi:hypothetical protein
MAQESTNSNEEMEQVRRRFEEFRRANPARSRFPEALWMAAAELAARQGVYRTARALKLAVPSLRKWLAKRSGAPKPTRAAKQKQERADLPAFVEFLAPAVSGVTNCSVEVESPQGAKLRLELKAIAAGEVAQLIRSFVNG